MRFTLRQLFFIILFLGLFLMTIGPIIDPDFWWHLRTGQLIAQTHAIPSADPFSFTYNGQPWVTQEWLSELIIYWLYQLGGFGLLIFASTLVITGAFLLAYFRSPKDSRPYIAGFTLLLGAITTIPTWGVRPQMISLLLFSLFLFLLDRYRIKGNVKYIIPLPLIMLIWVNLHAAFILGLVLLAIFIAGGFIEQVYAEIRKTNSLDTPTLKSNLNLVAILGLSFLATLINPNGLRALLYPLGSLTTGQQYIVEFLSPDFNLLEWQPLAIFLLAIIGAGMLSKKAISPTKIILTLFFGYAALRTMRHIPLFSIAAIPILAEQIDSLWRIRSELKISSRLLNLMISLFLIASVLIAGLRFVQVVRGQSKAEALSFPKNAVDWIKENQPKGNLFNSYYWGGYIIWRLYPQYPVYIDGRAGDWGNKYIIAYNSIYRAQSGWEQALDIQGVRLVLIEPASGLATALRQSPLWSILYEDQISVIFEKK
jgi:hypothetical protein